MTPITVIILACSLLSIYISIANIRMVQKMAKRNKEMQEMLAQQRRERMIQRSGAGRVWYDAHERDRVVTEYKGE